MSILNKYQLNNQMQYQLNKKQLNINSILTLNKPKNIKSNKKNKPNNKPFSLYFINISQKILNNL